MALNWNDWAGLKEIPQFPIDNYLYGGDFSFRRAQPLPGKTSCCDSEEYFLLYEVEILSSCLTAFITGVFDCTFFVISME